MQHLLKNIKSICIMTFILTAVFLNLQRVSLAKQKLEDLKDSKITIMTFNLENLFDTKDDPLKDDETYLPLKVKNESPDLLKKCKSLKSKDWKQQCLTLDWSPKVLQSKMKRIADVILKSHSQVGPDIIILQEVENLEVLEELRKNHLSAHYPHPAILIEGPDKRGIDVAILSKLKIKSETKIHNLTFTAEGKLEKSRLPVTRGILEAEFMLPDNTPLSVFGVHFPSQGTPSPARRQALEQLKKLMDERAKTNLVVAGGDFNITAFEEKHNKYFDKLSIDYLVSHLVGCKACRGSNYFHPRRSWSFLDVLIFSKNFNSPEMNWSLDRSSVRVFNKSLYQNNKWGSPEKFDFKKQQGVSDHWPVLADIFKNSSLSKGTRK